MNTQKDLNDFGKELDDLEATADEFSLEFRNDNAARTAYKKRVHEFATETYELVMDGKMSAKEGARIASSMRNRLMETARGRTSALGKSVAEFYKENGKSIEELLEQYSRKKYSRTFRSLATSQQDTVYREIILSSGRTNALINSRLARLEWLGNGILALSLAISLKRVLESRHKKETLADEIGMLLGGIGGGSAGGYAARVIFGPGCPVGVFAGMFLGSFLAADAAHEFVRDYFGFID